jgi:hypothetical protein
MFYGRRRIRAGLSRQARIPRVQDFLVHFSQSVGLFAFESAVIRRQGREPRPRFEQEMVTSQRDIISAVQNFQPGELGAGRAHNNNLVRRAAFGSGDTPCTLGTYK